MTTFAEFLEFSVLQPMIDGIIDGDGSHIVGLAGQVRVGSSDRDFFADRPDVTQLHYGWASLTEPEDVYWVGVVAPTEVLEFAFGTPEMSVQNVNSQIGILADALEDWLAETSIAWGQRCRVPKPIFEEPPPWV